MQPALDGMHCVMHMGRSLQCPMGMAPADSAAMGPDCPMHRGDALHCGWNCCPRMLPALLVAPGKQKMLSAEAALPAMLATVSPWAASAARMGIDPPSHAPPLYIVHRDFRI